MTRNEALIYLRNNKCGTIESLIHECGLEIVKGFELTGVIQRGQEANRTSSYKFTEEGIRIDKYANFNDYYNPTFLDKIQNFINQKTIDKTTLSI